MGLEKLEFKNVKRYLGKKLGHILKANDVKHHIRQRKPDLLILKALKQEMKSCGVLNGKIQGIKVVFSSRV
jgi:hypothetical protein